MTLEKKNIKKIGLGLLIFVFMVTTISGIYYIYQLKKQIQDLPQEFNQELDQRINQEFNQKFNQVCENFKKLKPIKENKQYVYSYKQSDVQTDWGRLYNQYNYCRLFIKGADFEEIWPDFIIGPGGFPTKGDTYFFYTRNNALSQIFKSQDACDSPVILEIVTSLKNLKEELKEIDTKIFCELIKSKLSESEINKICKGNIGCLSSLKDDINLCFQIEDSGKRQGCVDLIWYRRALKNNDKTNCLKIDSDFPFIDCQIHFIDNHPQMCDSIANEINEKFCKR